MLGSLCDWKPGRWATENLSIRTQFHEVDISGFVVTYLLTLPHYTTWRLTCYSIISPTTVVLAPCAHSWMQTSVMCNYSETCPVTGKNFSYSLFQVWNTFASVTHRSLGIIFTVQNVPSPIETQIVLNKKCSEGLDNVFGTECVFFFFRDTVITRSTSFIRKPMWFWIMWKHILTASVIYWSEFVATDPEVRVGFPALPDFSRSSGSGTGSTQLVSTIEELLGRKSSC
jgi:hypothetical protein